MKTKTFTGELGEVEYAFNTWAKGKSLTKDIIIHTVVHHLWDKRLIVKLSITIFYPEGSLWDKEPEQPKVPTRDVMVNGVRVELKVPIQ